MPKLSLYYPTKPYIVTQKWGNPNEAYRQFGFWKHNGIDFIVDADGIVRAMCDGVISKTGNIPKGAGIYLVLKTGLVSFHDGKECYADFHHMHAKELLVKQGDVIKAGDALMIADNTGFSTGPHTHISGIRIDEKGNKVDDDQAVNHTFDFSLYYNGKYADDINEKRPEIKFVKNLMYGMEASEVSKLQAVLKELGYFDHPEITGYYGRKTQQAVLDFQISNGVVKFGIESLFGHFFGPKSRKALELLINQ